MKIEGEIEREEERQRVETKKTRWGDRTEEWLCDAALRGDVGSLKEILANDKYILDKVLVGGFKGKNPLHVAISTGQREFVLELLRTKPELAEVVDTELGIPLHIASSKGHLEIVKLLAKIDKPELAEVVDTELRTALHIASSKGHLEIVRHLVIVSPGMCVARNREGNNPLHIAAMKGKVEVLKVLLETSPQAAQVRVDQGYTILHLCVNYNQLESLKVLLHEFLFDPDFVASTDTNGNNILHLAVFSNRYEIVEHVLRNTKIDVNARNGSGWTALDIYSQVGPIEVRIGQVLIIKKPNRSDELFSPSDPYWQKKAKDTLMIVSSLMATMAFQVGVNPPGGVWQDNSRDHVAGKAITATYYPKAYKFFMYFNTVGFLLSLTTILALIVVLPAKNKAFGYIGAGISWLAIMTMAFAYTFSIIVVSPTEEYKYVSLAILGTVIAWAVVISFIRVIPSEVQEIIVRKIVTIVVDPVEITVYNVISEFLSHFYYAAKARKGTAQSHRDTASTADPNSVSENDASV